jgi:N-succinyldiaminopimelate aminotransferase
LCQKYDVIAVTDEVYEHIIFDGAVHIPLATLPGMAERTVTISSAGKTFSMTGWKVGWTIASAELSRALFRIRQFTSYCGAAPLQEGMATALRAETDYYTNLTNFYQANRDFVVEMLADAGLNPIIPTGTYFALADISELGFENDVEFCRYLAREVGVVAIPPGAFYHNPADGAGMARFAFCKTRDVLEQAASRLEKLKQ